MDAKELTKLDALLGKASPGDWQANAYINGSGAFVEADHEGVILDAYGRLRDANAELIAELHNAAPALIALARRALELEDEIESLKYDGMGEDV